MIITVVNPNITGCQWGWEVVMVADPLCPIEYYADNKEVSNRLLSSPNSASTSMTHIQQRLPWENDPLIKKMRLWSLGLHCCQWLTTSPIAPFHPIQPTDINFNPCILVFIIQYAEWVRWSLGIRQQMLSWQQSIVQRSSGQWLQRYPTGWWTSIRDNIAKSHDSSNLHPLCAILQGKDKGWDEGYQLHDVKKANGRPAWDIHGMSGVTTNQTCCWPCRVAFQCRQACERANQSMDNNWEK